jgi:catechol-2,3-dioxygenase
MALRLRVSPRNADEFIEAAEIGPDALWAPTRMEKTYMLRDTDAVATLAVKDLRVAARFYEETLGLSRAGSDDEVAVFESGDTKINIYRSEFAGTNKATALTWTVDNVDDVVRTLQGRGVTFEHYDLPDTRREGDVHIAGDVRVAWFKDPDGNILSVVNR